GLHAFGNLEIREKDIVVVTMADRPTKPTALLPLDPEPRRNERVVRRAIAMTSVVAIASDRAVDETRVERRQRFRADTELARDTGGVTCDHDVGTSYMSERDSPIAGVVQIKHRAPTSSQPR